MSYRSIVFYLSLALAGIPVYRWYIARLSDGSDEPMGLLAVAVAVGLTWMRRGELQRGALSKWVGGLVLVGYAVATGVAPPMIQAALFLIGAGIVIGLGSRHPGVFGLLLLSLPVIASLQFYLGYPLRMAAAAGSSGLLKICGFGVERSGTVLEWNGQTIMVDPACSGLNMLWMIGFLFIVIAAWKRFSFAKTFGFGVVALVCAVLANSVRVYLLFFKETHIVDLPEWTHAGIGLLVFIPLAWLILKSTKLAGFPAGQNPVRDASPSLRLVVGMVAVAGFILWTNHEVSGKMPGSGRASWPAKWNDEWLEPMPLSRVEREFAKGFPGHIGVFRAGDRRVILKQVNRATRKLHSISDCMQATGYDVSRIAAGSYRASKGAHCVAIEETIYAGSPGSDTQWRDVSEWYWNALMNRDSGPWFAVVEMQDR